MLEIEGEIFDLSKDSINLDGVVEIFKGWVQSLQLESLKPGKNAKSLAIQTLDMMEILLTQVKKEKGIDLMVERKELSEDDFSKLTFFQRCMQNLIKYSLSRAQWFYEDVKLMAQGKQVSDLNEYDAAKRIGLGTIVGKYQQKALALKGITVDEFKKIRDEAAGIFKNCDMKTFTKTDGGMSGKPGAEGMVMKEPFMQKDFLEALGMCNSQFDLFEAFPLQGVQIKLKRFNGSLTNPWLTKVLFLGKEEIGLLDTATITKAYVAQHNIELKNEAGEMEIINAVLPLFKPEDEDMKPLLQSRMYNFLMTYNVTQNVEAIYEDAYLSLLTSALFQLLTKEKETDYNTYLCKAIETSIRVYYYDNKDFVSFREQLIKNPIKTIANDDEMKKYGQIDLSKALIHLLMISRDQYAQKFEIEHVFKAIVGHFFYSMVKSQEFQVHTYLKARLGGGLAQKANDEIKKTFPNCFTNGDLRRNIYTVFEKLLKSGAQYDYSWDISELSKHGVKVRIEVLEKVAAVLGLNPPTKEDYILNIARAFVSGTYEQMFSDETTIKTLDQMTAAMGKKITSNVDVKDVKQLPAVRTAIEESGKEFREYFKKIHYEIYPISQQALKDHAKATKTNFNQYLYGTETNMVRNACLAKNCPFYLKPQGRLNHHMDIWDCELPLAFHKTVRTNRSKNVEQIFEMFSHGVEQKNVSANQGAVPKKNFEYYFESDKKMDGYDEEKYGRKVNEVFDYIQKLKEAYQKILD